MSPVSTLPSFRTMWCVTLSLFLNTTCWPPNAEGLGVKACVPFWPTIVIVIVAAAAGAADGAVVLEDPLLPPLQPKAARPSVNIEALNNFSRIRQFLSWYSVRSFVQD